MNENTVEEVKVSPASRREARGQRDPNDLRSELKGLRDDKERLLRRRLQSVETLRDVNHELRKPHLPFRERQTLMNDRAALVKEQEELNHKVSGLNIRIRSLQSDLYDGDNGSTLLRLAEMHRSINELSSQVRALAVLVNRLVNDKH